MEPAKHTILFVDDEQNILHSLKRLLRREGYKLLTAASGEEAFQVLKENEIHLVISDQRMPEMNGTDFLAQVKEQYPDILRIILTGYTDIDSITESINKGHIYKFFLKPWNDQNLKLEIRQALDQYELIEANKRLDETVINQNRRLKEVNENLEEIVAERTRELELQNQALELSRAILEDLPLPIIGVDREAVIVLANKQAQTLLEHHGFAVGASLGDYFPREVESSLHQVLAEHHVCHVEGNTLKGKRFHADLLPLSGRFGDRGVIITLSC